MRLLVGSLNRYETREKSLNYPPLESITNSIQPLLGFQVIKWIVFKHQSINQSDRDFVQIIDLPVLSIDVLDSPLVCELVLEVPEVSLTVSVLPVGKSSSYEPAQLESEGEPCPGSEEAPIGQHSIKLPPVEVFLWDQVGESEEG